MTYSLLPVTKLLQNSHTLNQMKKSYGNEWMNERKPYEFLHMPTILAFPFQPNRTYFI